MSRQIRNSGRPTNKTLPACAGRAVESAYAVNECCPPLVLMSELSREPPLPRSPGSGANRSPNSPPRVPPHGSTSYRVVTFEDPGATRDWRPRLHGLSAHACFCSSVAPGLCADRGSLRRCRRVPPRRIAQRLSRVMHQLPLVDPSQQFDRIRHTPHLPTLLSHVLGFHRPEDPKRLGYQRW